MSILKLIKKDRCDCGGTVRSEDTDSWGQCEERRFSCGLILQQGGRDGPELRVFRRCPKSNEDAEYRAELERLYLATVKLVNASKLSEDQRKAFASDLDRIFTNRKVPWYLK